LSVLAYGVVAWLFLVGIYGVVTSRNLIHLVVCLSGPAVDAVMQALALTDVVVGAAVTALLLALVVQVHKRAGTLDPDALRATRN
jgi:multicomponent Na+:H+ antiporter subunit C